ncbi:DNA repair protein rad51d [Coemansia sp. RSA 1843]|nr:DNA repair protein rad51d [Coemansia sp. RSA 1843]
MPYLESAQYIRQWVEDHQPSQNSGTEAFPFDKCLTALKNIGIHTDYDLVVRFDVLPDTPVPLHRHIKALRMAVLEHSASPGQTAMDILGCTSKDVLYENRYPSHIKSGINDLDDLLDGGLRIGHVTELCGKSGSGKTQLAIEFAVSHLVSTNAQACDSKVYYLQSSPLPLWRVEDVLKARLLSCGSSDSSLLFQKAMERLVIVDCYNNDSLLSFLYSYSARLNCASNDSENGTSMDLAIIDSVRPLVINASDAYNNRYILIHAIRTALRSICALRSSRCVTVLITNGISQRGPSEPNNHSESSQPGTTPIWPLNIQPSLGASWAQISHTHVLVSGPEDYLLQEARSADDFGGQGTRSEDGFVDTSKHRKTRAMLLKSTHLPAGKSCTFSII